MTALAPGSFFVVALLATAQVTNDNLLKPDPKVWLHYSGSYDSQRHSPLKQINSSNVGSLQVKWIYHMTGAIDLEAVPIVVDGVMYISQWNRVEALDARTGRIIWQYQRQPATRDGSVGWRSTRTRSGSTRVPKCPASGDGLESGRRAGA